MLAVWHSQHHLPFAQVIVCGLCPKDKSFAIVDDGLVGGVLYDNWQSFCLPFSIDTQIGSVLVGI